MILLIQGPVFLTSINRKYVGDSGQTSFVHLRFWQIQKQMRHFSFSSVCRDTQRSVVTFRSEKTRLFNLSIAPLISDGGHESWIDLCFILPQDQKLFSSLIYCFEALHV